MSEQNDKKQTANQKQVILFGDLNEQNPEPKDHDLMLINTGNIFIGHYFSITKTTLKYRVQSLSPRSLGK